MLCLIQVLCFGLLCCYLIFNLSPLSCGILQESGLASWMGGHLQPLAQVPPAAAVMLITAFLACFTEFASNTATIIIFLPVIAELVRLVYNLNIYSFRLYAKLKWKYIIRLFFLFLCYILAEKNIFTYQFTCVRSLHNVSAITLTQMTIRETNWTTILQDKEVKVKGEQVLLSTLSIMLLGGLVGLLNFCNRCSYVCSLLDINCC